MYRRRWARLSRFGTLRSAVVPLAHTEVSVSKSDLRHLRQGILSHYSLPIVNTRRQLVCSLLLLCWALVLVSPAVGQTDQSESKRKVVTKVMPAYPEIARTMRIKGVVRIEAVVAPNGSVKTTHVLGGHPLLAQAADDAVRKWRWESSGSETKEMVEVRFDPDSR